MASYSDLYTQSVESSLLQILGIVASYYADQHGVAVEADELMEVLTSTKATTKTSRATATAKTSASKTAATKTTKAGAKPTAKASKERRSREQGQLKGLCLYVITRGVNEGKYCTVKAVNGKNTCSSCRTKKENLGFYVDDDDPDNEEVDTGRAPGKYTGAVPDDEDDVQALSVVPYGDSKHIYVTEDGTPILLLVADGDDGEEETFTVIAQLSAKNKIIALNKVGVKRAQLLGLEVNMDMLGELQEKGLIQVDAPSGSPGKGEEVDSVPGMNVEKSSTASGGSKKPNLPTRKTESANKPVARRPAARKPVVAVEVDEDQGDVEHEEHHDDE